jgi:argininosuccinate lyase
LHAIKRGVEIQEIPSNELHEMSELIDTDVLTVLSLEHTLSTKSTVGGTSPQRVLEALSEARRSLLK